MGKTNPSQVARERRKVSIRKKKTINIIKELDELIK